MSETILLFSIDGMRPDGLQQATTPNLDRLIAEGASTMRARTVMPSVTLPCHTSMFRGIDVPRHGITTNIFTPLARPVPSVIDVAAQAGKRCAMFYNWGPLRDLCGPESLEFSYMVNASHLEHGDDLVTDSACRHLTETPFDFAFVYLGYTDTAGHNHGWMSDPYLRAIERADACVGRIIGECEQAGIGLNVIVQSDHGGHDRSHGTDCDEDMTIPWIAWGNRARQGYTINTPVNIFDTCSTVASLLDIPASPIWEGRTITDAFQS